MDQIPIKNHHQTGLVKKKRCIQNWEGTSSPHHPTSALAILKLGSYSRTRKEEVHII